MKAYVRGPQLLVRFGMGANRVEKYSEAHSARARLPASAGPCITLPVNDNVSPNRAAPVSNSAPLLCHSALPDVCKTNAAWQSVGLVFVKWCAWRRWAAIDWDPCKNPDHEVVLYPEGSQEAPVLQHVTTSGSPLQTWGRGQILFQSNYSLEVACK